MSEAPKTARRGEMNNAARDVLRTSVMAFRVDLRNARIKLQTARREMTASREAYHKIYRQIADIQTALGEEVDVDPAYKEEDDEINE